jgi:hypothetical protein
VLSATEAGRFATVASMRAAEHGGVEADGVTFGGDQRQLDLPADDNYFCRLALDADGR